MACYVTAILSLFRPRTHRRQKSTSTFFVGRPSPQNRPCGADDFVGSTVDFVEVDRIDRTVDRIDQVQHVQLWYKAYTIGLASTFVYKHQKCI